MCQEDGGVIGSLRPARTPVVQSRTDVNVRPLRGTQVGKSGLDSVVRSDLLSQTRSARRRRACPRDVATLTVSISMTVLKPFSDNLAIGARKFPAAPVGEEESCEYSLMLRKGKSGAYRK